MRLELLVFIASQTLTPLTRYYEEEEEEEKLLGVHNKFNDYDFAFNLKGFH